ncbi:MAG: hypothetical protein U0X75_22610 [Acidobacteriota bacterium]
MSRAQFPIRQQTKRQASAPSSPAEGITHYAESGAARSEALFTRRWKAQNNRPANRWRATVPFNSHSHEAAYKQPRWFWLVLWLWPLAAHAQDAFTLTAASLQTGQAVELDTLGWKYSPNDDRVC